MLQKIKKRVASIDVETIYLAKGGFWLMMAKSSSALSSLIVTIVLTNLLPKEEFGQYTFILSVVAIITIFTLPGMGTAIIRYKALSHDLNLQKIAKSKILYGLLGSVVSLLGAFYYYLHDNNLTLTYAFIITAIFIPLYEAFFIYSFYYKGCKNFKTPAIYESISKVAQAIIMLTTILLTKSILALLFSFFLGITITRLFFYKKMIKSTYARHDDNSSIEVIKYGKYLTLIAIFGIILANLDKLLLWHYFGAESTAIYAIAILIPTTLSIPIELLAQVLFPKLSNLKLYNKATLHKTLKEMLKLSSLSLLIPIFYIPTAPLFFKLLFPSYTESILQTQIMALLVPLLVLNAFMWNLLLAQKKTRYMPSILIIGIIIQLLTFFIFKDYLDTFVIYLMIGVYNIAIISSSYLAMRYAE